MGADRDSERLSPDELRALGFTSIGTNVQVSRDVRAYDLQGSIGDNARIDDFTILKGRVSIGSSVHVAAHCVVSGVGGTVILGNYSTLSTFCSVFTASDDYASPMLTGSQIPRNERQGSFGDVVLEQGVIVGSHSVLLPGVVLEEFASIGAMCIVTDRVPAGVVLVTGAGRPRKAGQRDLSRLREAAARTASR